MLEGRREAIHAERDRKLELAREERVRQRAKQRNVSYDKSTRPEDRQCWEATRAPSRCRRQMVWNVVSSPFMASTPLTCL